ncbi:hypothetical protein LTR15_009122 [Elasticomyces elasticus]|nr:hypothetical protein LTR15_009122 [Elasticomyces elasticus]
MSDKSGNLALLIDGDNVSPKIIVGLMAEIATYGTASVRRIYGDWTRPDLKGRKACLLDHSILPMQQFAYTTGKNSTDGAMIIDAMDLLYTNHFSAFCIVSSDSDLTRLAARVREQGVTVYGFGERETTPAFIAACDKFVYFDVLNIPAHEGSLIKTRSLTQLSSALEAPQSTSSQAVATIARPVKTVGTGRKPLDPFTLDALESAIQALGNFDGGYANLADIGHYLSKISPDLNARNYGYKRLSDMVEASGIATLKWKTIGNNPPIALVRLKTSPAASDSE